MDDAAVFMAPIKRDIDNLSTILKSFGEATGLQTNFNKSSVVPIRYANLDLEHIIQSLPAKKSSFPNEIFGAIPLSICT